jgi:hypothetical protein
MDHEDDDFTPEIIDVTVADLETDAEAVRRERRALAPVQKSLESQGFYAYGTFDDQRRFTIAVDDEAGRVDVRVGDDGFEVELGGSSPGLFSDEENEWKRRAHERLARMQIANIARGQLAPHQRAFWDDVDHGVGVRLLYQVSFARAPQIGAFVREHFPEVDQVLGFVESQLSV